VPSVTLKIISLGFLLVCTRTSSSSPHFALISWPSASISSLLFVSIFTPPLHDLNILTLEAPMVLHYLKAPTALKLTAVWFIAF